MGFYLLGILLLLLVLLIIPREAFLKNRLLVIMAILLYAILYFLLIYHNTQIPLNSGKFHGADLALFALLVFLIPFRPFTLLNKKEYYMSFDVLHKSLTLVLLLLINYRGVNLGFNFPVNLNYWIETLVITILSIAVSAIVAIRIHFLEFAKTKFQWKEFLIIFVYMFLFVALPEEIIFRGAFLSYLMNYIPFQILSITISTIVFGLIHVRYGMKMVILSGIAGLFYSVLYLLTGNLICVAMMHTMVNLFRKYYLVNKRG